VGPDTSTEFVRLNCQADLSQHSSKWDFKPFNWWMGTGLVVPSQRLQSRPKHGGSVWLKCGQCPGVSDSLAWIIRAKQTTISFYTGWYIKIKCQQSNGGPPYKPLIQIIQIAYMAKVVSYIIKQSVNSTLNNHIRQRDVMNIRNIWVARYLSSSYCLIKSYCRWWSDSYKESNPLIQIMQLHDNFWDVLSSIIRAWLIIKSTLLIWHMKS